MELNYFVFFIQLLVNGYESAYNVAQSTYLAIMEHIKYMNHIIECIFILKSQVCYS